MTFKLSRTLLLAPALLMLTACDGTLPNFSGFNYPDTGRNTYKLHEIAVPETDITVPPPTIKQQVMSAVTPAQNTVVDTNAEPIMMKVKGLNVDNTYSPNLKSVNIPAPQPTMTAKPLMNTDMVSAPIPLDAPVVHKINHTEKFATQPVKTSAMASNNTLIPAVPKAAPMNALPSATLNDIRTGVHANYVRLVFDLMDSPQTMVSIDNSEDLLVVEFVNTRARIGSMDMVMAKNPLLSSYKIS